MRRQRDGGAGAVVAAPAPAFCGAVVGPAERLRRGGGGGGGVAAGIGGGAFFRVGGGAAAVGGGEEGGVRGGAEDAGEVGDGRGRVFGGEQRAQDGEAGGEDADIAFDVHPDADGDGGPANVGEFELGKERDADDAGYADAVCGSGELVVILGWEGRGRQRDVDAQAAEKEEADDRHAFWHGHVHAPQPRDRQYQDHQIGDDVHGRDGKADQVLVDAVAVGD